jgi:hypothetical protein
MDPYYWIIKKSTRRKYGKEKLRFDEVTTPQGAPEVDFAQNGQNLLMNLYFLQENSK